MRSLFGTIACSVLFLSNAAAADADTAKTYHTNEVVVTATRTAIHPEDAPAQVRIVSTEDIQRINGTTTADIMTLVNGVSVSDYGATGGMKTITTRGLPASNVTILIDGNPINDQQNGLVDLSLLPLSSIDRIEFVSDGASALYGGNATGGVVNLITRKASQDMHISISGGLGSFAARSGAFELGGRFKDIGMIAGISQESGSDDFPFLYHRTNAADTTLYRTNADYTRTLAYWNGDYQPSNNISVNSFVHYVKFERGTPGSLSWPDAHSRQSDETFRIALGVTYQIEENFLVTINGSYNHTIEIFSGSWGSSTYKNNQGLLNAQVEWRPLECDRVIGGAEYGENTLDVDGWGLSPLRIQKSAYLSNEYTLQRESDWFDRFIFYQTLREDYFSDVKDDALSPKLGANIRLNKEYNVHIRGSWGKNFRVPTFNDWYYANNNNPNLRPERSTTFDGGVVGSLDRTGRQTLEITYFHIDATDKIVSQKITPFTSVPYNLGQAENSGLEVRYDYHSADDRFEAYAGFSFVDARKKDKISETDSTYNKFLNGVPLSSGVLGLSFETAVGRISINETYTGLQYFDPTFTNTNTNSYSLSAYTLTDVHFMERFSLSRYQITINASVKNIFDTDYQSYTDYPMPGRSFRVSAAIEY
jgi:vitamin B12 transporter